MRQFITASSVLAALERGRTLYGGGKYADAAASYEKARALAPTVFGANSLNVVGIQALLADCYQQMGEYAKAESFYQQALTGSEARPGGRDDPLTAELLMNLASLYRELGQYAKAEPLYRRALEIREAKLGKDHPDTARALFNLALLHANLGRWDISAGCRDRNRRAARNYVASTLPILSDREQEQFLKIQDETAFHAALSHGLLRRDHPAEAALSAGWVLNGKAVAGQVRAEGMLLARESRDPRTGPVAAELTATRQALAALALHPPRGGQAAARARQVADLAAKEQDLARRLTQHTGRPTTAAWAELADVRKALPPSAVLVEIARFDRKKLDWKPGERFSLGERYAAWVIPPTGDVRVVDLGDAGPIDAAVKAARTALEASAKTIREEGEPAAEAQLRKPLGRLAKLVLHPLLPHIGKAETWVVSPDGNLWLVPWAALPLPGGAYAVEMHTVTYLVTGRDLLATKNGTVRPTAPVVLADPDFDLGRTEAEAITRRLVRDSVDGPRGLPRDFKLGGVRRLPGTAVEAAAIAPRLKQYAGEEPRVWTDKQALAGVFKAAKYPRVVVLSTHGFFLEDEGAERPGEGRGGPFADDRKPAGPAAENPLLRCGPLLAGCNHAGRAGPGADTGVLTGLEIVGTDLRGTELVVLSACETGLGDVRNGEGVAGLRQAFQLAGAESVVATLWQVPDRESALLAAAFFDGLARGRPRDAALGEAQQAAVGRRRERSGAAHPFFWAAYTLTGQTK